MGNKLRHEGDEVRIKVIWPDIYIYIHINIYIFIDLIYTSRWYVRSYVRMSNRVGITRSFFRNDGSPADGFLNMFFNILKTC